MADSQLGSFSCLSIWILKWKQIARKCWNFRVWKGVNNPLHKFASIFHRAVSKGNGHCTMKALLGLQSSSFKQDEKTLHPTSFAWGRVWVVWVQPDLWKLNCGRLTCTVAEFDVCCILIHYAHHESLSRCSSSWYNSIANTEPGRSSVYVNAKKRSFAST